MITYTTEKLTKKKNLLSFIIIHPISFKVNIKAFWLPFTGKYFIGALSVTLYWKQQKQLITDAIHGNA